jgi:hypothetical protein
MDFLKMIKWISRLYCGHIACDSVAKFFLNGIMGSRDMNMHGPNRDRGKNTYRFFGLFNTRLDLLEGGLDIFLDEVYLVLPHYGDGRLGGELLWARPPHTPVPSHVEFGTRWRAQPCETGVKISIRR